MTTSITEPTPEQRKQLRRLLEDASDRFISKKSVSKEGVQRIIELGPQLQLVVSEALEKTLRSRKMKIYPEGTKVYYPGADGPEPYRNKQYLVRGKTYTVADSWIERDELWVSFKEVPNEHWSAGFFTTTKCSFCNGEMVTVPHSHWPRCVNADRPDHK